jgi:hypothetical protein
VPTPALLGGRHLDHLVQLLAEPLAVAHDLGRHEDAQADDRPVDGGRRRGVRAARQHAVGELRRPDAGERGTSGPPTSRTSPTARVIPTMPPLTTSPGRARIVSTEWIVDRVYTVDRTILVARIPVRRHCSLATMVLISEARLALVEPPGMPFWSGRSLSR